MFTISTSIWHLFRGHSYLLDNLLNHQQWRDTIENFSVSNDKIWLSYIGSLVHKFNAWLRITNLNSSISCYIILFSTCTNLNLHTNSGYISLTRSCYLRNISLDFVRRNTLLHSGMILELRIDSSCSHPTVQFCDFRGHRPSWINTGSIW